MCLIGTLTVRRTFKPVQQVILGKIQESGKGAHIIKNCIIVKEPPCMLEDTILDTNDSSYRISIAAFSARYFLSNII